MKSIICYYSRLGENYVSGAIRNLETGNTERAAAILSDLTGVPAFHIEQEHPYSFSYNECIEQARKDQKSDARPKLKSPFPDLSEADVVYLGYPNYWNTMPMALFTFLESEDLKGKTICPFCTHEGSGLGSSVQDIEKLCPDSIVTNGLAIHGSHVDECKEAMNKWISRIQKGNE